MPGKTEKFDRFVRAEKRGSGKHTSYAQEVSRRAASRDNELLRAMIIELAICILVPPYGIFRICSDKRFGLMFRGVSCVIGGIILFLWFMLIIPNRKPAAQSVTYVNATAVQEYSYSD
ncbi:MAG: hypothetical protein IKR85_02840 [Clostridia bacterium]|nr:hypothetical protein [Clostridia bacterium]